MPDITLNIRLQPGRENGIKLSQGTANQPLFGVYVSPGDKITWRHRDQGGAPSIRRWVVSFIQNQCSKKPPEPGKPGTPLRDSPNGGNEVWQVHGEANGDDQETWVAHDVRDFQFAVAVVDENGDLYALDPEIRVRAPVPPITKKNRNQAGKKGR